MEAGTIARLTLAAAILLAGLAPAAAAGSAGEVVEQRRDGQDRPLVRVSEVPGQPGVRRIDAWLYAERGDAVQPDGHAGTRAAFPAAWDPSTDCASDDHALHGYRWAEPYVAVSNRHAGVLDRAGRTWNAETAGTPFGAVLPGSGGQAPALDGENRIVFDGFGDTDWLAQTTTFVLRVEGEPAVAVESDQVYNADHGLATDGSLVGFDVRGIATHELGHTLGLGHSGAPCLTMFPSVSKASSVEARTLGDGDVIGVRALYGPLPAGV